MNAEQELLQWLINQGVAVAVAAIVLIRLDTVLHQLLREVQKLTDELERGRGTS